MGAWTSKFRHALRCLSAASLQAASPTPCAGGPAWKGITQATCLFGCRALDLYFQVTYRSTEACAYMMQGCHTPPPPPHPMVSPPAPPVGWGLWWCPSPPPLWFRCCGGTPTQLRLWLALFAVVPAAGGTADDVVLQTATRVDNRIIFDIMLNIIIVVVIFIISTIKEQLPPSPSPYNPHD